jgi:hypothetical protein
VGDRPILSAQEEKRGGKSDCQKQREEEEICSATLLIAEQGGILRGWKKKFTLKFCAVV